MSLVLATWLTLGYFVAGIAALTLAIMVYMGDASVGVAIVFVVLTNLVMWMIGPWITDFMMRWLYSARFLEPAEAQAQPWWGFVARVCGEHRITPPRFAIIDDANPTAFTYGSTAHRARVVITRGLVNDLDAKELEAVIAHELGHVVNRDFIIMTLASTMLQILYQIYAWASRLARNAGASGRKNNPGALLFIIAFGALALYWIGTYLLLFLSRTREYAADEFAARATGDGNLLASGLLKVAYGIAAAPDTEKTASLLRATRAQGVFDLTHAKGVALVAENSKSQPASVERALAFDVISPWAWIVQLTSTHPLIGRRLERLMKFADRPRFDFARVRAQEVDPARLRAGFTRDVTIYVLPWIGVALYAAAVASALLWPGGQVGTIGAAIGIAVFVVGVFARVAMRFPGGEFENTTVLSCLSDLYASPVRGRRVALDGTTIGRGQAGYIFSEDMLFRDKTGLIFLNYESGIPIFGNLYFAWRKLEPLIGMPATARGWFLRGTSHHLELKDYKTATSLIKGRARLWAIIGAIVMAILGSAAGLGLLVPLIAGVSAAVVSKGFR